MEREQFQQRPFSSACVGDVVICRCPAWGHWMTAHVTRLTKQVAFVSVSGGELRFRRDNGMEYGVAHKSYGTAKWYAHLPVPGEIEAHELEQRQEKMRRAVVAYFRTNMPPLPLAEELYRVLEPHLQKEESNG